MLYYLFSIILDRSLLTSSWKVYAQVLGSEIPDLKRVLAELHISLTKQQLRMDAAPLLKLVMKQFFNGHGGLVDSLLQTFPDPITAAEGKVRRFWKGEMGSTLGEAMCKCDPAGPLVINVVRMYRTQDAQGALDFVAFGRVMSGTVQYGQEVDVCGEG